MKKALLFPALSLLALTSFIQETNAGALNYLHSTQLNIRAMNCDRLQSFISEVQQAPVEFTEILRSMNLPVASAAYYYKNHVFNSEDYRKISRSMHDSLFLETALETSAIKRCS